MDIDTFESFRCDTLTDLKLIYNTVRDLFPEAAVEITSREPPYRLTLDRSKSFRESDIDTSLFNIIPKDDFGLKKMKDAWKLAAICGEMVTKQCFEPPNDLEMEKVYRPLLQMKKKHYTGRMYEYNDKKPDEIPDKFKTDTKGIVLKRRDNVPIIRKIYKECLDVILEKGEDGVEEAKQIYRKHIENILTGNIDMTDFTITKSMRHNYAKTNRCEKHPTKLFKSAKCKEVEECTDCKVSIPHVVLAQKIKERSPGDAPASGDRIPFVYVDIGNMTAKQFERVEDPQYAKEHGMKLDLLYYWEHQIEKPMSRLFKLLTDDPEGICRDLIGKHINEILQKNYDQKITPYAKRYLPENVVDQKKKHDRTLAAAARKRKKEQITQSSTLDKFVVSKKRKTVITTPSVPITRSEDEKNIIKQINSQFI